MEQIIIKDRTYNEAVRRYCYVVNEYLGVVAFSDHYKIYRIKQGKPFIGTKFFTKEDAEGAAKVFSEIYGEYFPIWDNKEWEDANIPALCAWSVKNGINLYEFVKKTEAENKPIRCASLYLEKI